MTELVLGSATALWLGVLTSISPCPLATNIAAVTYIGKHLERPGRLVLAGAAYALGRVAAYVVLAGLVVGSLLSAPGVSQALQKYMGLVLGPVLIVAGMFLLNLLSVPLPGPIGGDALQKRVASLGVVGAALLGVMFALSFCPVSAALFFGSLIPLALNYESPVVLPTAYGIGTGLPVLGFAFLIAAGARTVAKAFDVIQKAEAWGRRATGILFILVGVYLCLVNIFGLPLGLWSAGT